VGALASGGGGGSRGARGYLCGRVSLCVGLLLLYTRSCGQLVPSKELAAILLQVAAVVVILGSDRQGSARGEGM
jgi:hypothetical protein